MNVPNQSPQTGQVPASYTLASNLVLIGLLLACVLPGALAWKYMGLVFKLTIKKDTRSQFPLLPLGCSLLIFERKRPLLAEVPGAGFWAPLRSLTARPS